LGYTNPSRDAAQIIRRNKDRFDGYLTRQFEASGIQKRNMTFLNIKGIIAFCMLSEMPKALQFQRWADIVLEKEITNIPQNIELLIKRKRIAFTDQLQDHGFSKKYEYINITRGMKKELDIDIPKEKCDLIQKMKIAISEDLATLNLLQSNAKGYYEVKPICVNSAKVIASNSIQEINNG
jgi:hypothetical protein